MTRGCQASDSRLPRHALTNLACRARKMRTLRDAQSALLHPQGAVDADHGAVEIATFDDELGQTAIFIRIPQTLRQVTSAARLSWTSCGRPVSIGVAKMPGAMVITRMPSRARSRAIGRVMPTIPPLDEA